MPTFVTALAIASVDHAYLLQPGRHESVVGAGLFIGRLDDRKVHFDLKVQTLVQADFPGDLIEWLNDEIPAAGLIAAYRLRGYIVPALAQLPVSGSTPIMAELHEYRPRAVLDLRGVERTGETLPLVEACAAFHIPAANRDPAERFLDWAFDRTDQVAAALELDAIATFRLALRQFQGGAVEMIEPALRDWLETSKSSAALLHHTSSSHS